MINVSFKSEYVLKTKFVLNKIDGVPLEQLQRQQTQALFGSLCSVQLFCHSTANFVSRGSRNKYQRKKNEVNLKWESSSNRLRKSLPPLLDPHTT